jgi:hypothetical protein
VPSARPSPRNAPDGDKAAHDIGYNVSELWTRRRLKFNTSAFEIICDVGINTSFASGFEPEEFPDLFVLKDFSEVVPGPCKSAAAPFLIF